MKKTLSVILAVFMLLSCLGMLASADTFNDGFTQVYTIRPGNNSTEKIKINGIYGRNDVAAGEDFSFTITYLGSYRPDQTTVIKAYPASYPADFVGTYEDSTEIITLTADPETGIYTIYNIQEDWCVEAFSLQEEGFAGIKNLLMNIITAIVEFFANLKNLFGI